MANNAIHVKDFRTEIPGELNDYTWEFPPVVATTKAGKQTQWKLLVRLVTADDHENFLPIDDSYFDSKEIPPIPSKVVGWIKVDFITTTGKTKKSDPTFVYKGLNEGKSNGTNTWTQALRDAYGLYNKQVKKTPGNHNTQAGITLYLPMLARNIKDVTGLDKTITEEKPAYVQRKYNGVRAMTAADGTVAIMSSRKKNLYPGFDVIKAELLPVLQMFTEEGRALYLDGELYNHGGALQDISGAARRSESADDSKFTYMIYDCYIPSESTLLFSERYAILRSIFEDFKFEHCQLVETFTVTSLEEADDYYKMFLEEKYEGSMIRLDGPYVVSTGDYRSRDLIKVKPTYDAEFTIIGWETGKKGKAAQALMIVCEVNGIRFPVTPTGEIPAREALARKMIEIEPNGKTHFENHWLGKPLIVTFDEYSKTGVPQRARTDLIIRTWD